MKYITPFVLSALGAILQSSVQAQTLTLFEGRGNEEVPDRVPAPAFGPDGMGPTAATTAYTLRGIARFGDDYVATLERSDGNTVTLSWQGSAANPLPQDPGYEVLEITSQTLVLHQPTPCVPQESRGVSCIDANTARLSLATLSPIQRQPPNEKIITGPLPMDDTDSSVVSDESGNPVFVNPFAAAVMEAQEEDPEQGGRAERARARAERLQQFQVERIPEGEVPPGMRLVRTPFGDRLVPVRQ